MGERVMVECLELILTCVAGVDLEACRFAGVSVFLSG